MPLLPFRRAASYHDVPPITWLLRPWIVKGAITELIGTQKDAGKTTLLMRGMVRSVLEGTPFLGQRPEKGPVLYLTEQPLTIVRKDLEAAGIIDHPDLYMLQWHDVHAIDWKSLITKLRKDALELKAALIIIDTVSQFSLKGDMDEDKSKDALEAMKPLQLCTMDGLSIVLVRHEPKVSKGTAQAGRGSTAWSGAVDIVLRVRRVLNHKARPSVRVLEARGRLSDETPESTEIELTPAGYTLAGKAAAPDPKATILEALKEGALSAVDLAQITKLDLKIVEKTIKSMHGNLKAEKKGSLVRYSLAKAEV